MGPPRTTKRLVRVEGFQTVGIFRFCRRCKCWRSIGNFTNNRLPYGRTAGKVYPSHTCRRCLTPENKHTSYIEKRWWWPASA